MNSGERRPKRRITWGKTKNTSMKTRRTNSLLATKAHGTKTSQKVWKCNATVHPKLTLVSACWSLLDRRPRINSLSCLLLSRFPFTFFWFVDSLISVFPLQQINLTAKQYSAANFNGSWLLLLGLPYGVTRLCSIGRRHDRVDNIFDVLSS